MAQPHLSGRNPDYPVVVHLPEQSTWAPIVMDDSSSLLIVAMDLGMTFSGISYAYIPPEANRNARYTEPRVRDVMFGVQENESGDTKVPTVLFRDEARNVWYCGAETLALTSEDKSTLVKFEWFKQQLSSNGLEESDRNPLPNVTPVLLFSVFYGYMYRCLKAQFEAKEFKGPEVWHQIVRHAVYVITHPNDWTSWHKDLLRNALIDARIIGERDDDRVTFMTEGEAGLHWWLKEEPHPLSIGNQIVICDAGGGTIGVSSYTVDQVEPLKVKESRPSDTRSLGAVFVTRDFRGYIEKQLEHSKYGRGEIIDRITKVFDTTIKRRFSSNAKANQQIEFGYSDDHDEQYGIRAGILSISAELVKPLFEPSCTAAAEAIRNHATPNCYVVLIGGFSDNPWLYHCVSTGLSDITPNVKRVASQPGKAVARGAVEFYLNESFNSSTSRALGAPFAYSSAFAELDEDTQRKLKPSLVPNILKSNSRRAESYRLTDAFADVSSPSSRVDVESETDVILRLDRLNSQIEGLSLLAYDWGTFKPQQPEKAVPAVYMKILPAIVHRSIIDQLSGKSTTDSSAMSLLQFAWEIIISRYITLMGEPFSSSKELFFLQEINTDKIAREALEWINNPDRYANWGSMRHKELRKSIAEGSLLGDLSLRAASLCYSCACLLLQPTIPGRIQFILELSSRILELLSDAAQLHTIITKGIVSQNLSLICPEWGTSVNPLEVTLEEGLQPVATVDIILGVTQVGIGPIASAKKRILRKATVVSEGVLSHLREVAN